MGKYKYENPIDKGFKQFKLTKKQHNDIFNFRQIKWYHKYEYYYNDSQILLHQFYSLPLVIFQTILFPVQILIEGYSDAKDTTKGLYNQKQMGRFVLENIWRGTERYEKTINLIKK